MHPSLPPENRKSYGFLMFSGGRERCIGKEIMRIFKWNPSRKVFAVYFIDILVYAYLEPSQISVMERFSENSLYLKVVSFFHKNAQS